MSLLVPFFCIVIGLVLGVLAGVVVGMLHGDIASSRWHKIPVVNHLAVLFDHWRYDNHPAKSLTGERFPQPSTTTRLQQDSPTGQHRLATASSPAPDSGQFSVVAWPGDDVIDRAQSQGCDRRLSHLSSTASASDEDPVLARGLVSDANSQISVLSVEASSSDNDGPLATGGSADSGADNRAERDEHRHGMTQTGLFPPGAPTIQRSQDSDWPLSSAESYRQRVLNQTKSLTRLSDGSAFGSSSILWQMKDGICVRDINGNLLSYNPAWLSIWNLDAPSQGMYTRVQMLGCYREDGISPLPKDEAPMHLALNGQTVNNHKLIVDNHTTDDENALSRPGPRARTYLVSGYPLLDESGRQYAAFVTMRDVTERTEAVNALSRERSLLRNVLEVIPDGFVLRDMTGKAILHNKAYRQKRGPFNVDAFTEMPLVENLYQPDNDKPVPRNECPMFRALAGEGFVNQRVYLRKKDGVKLDLLISGYPLFNENNEQIGAFTLERDVTDIKLVSQIRARSSRLAALGMVVGGVAHDFNNQLAAILGSAQVARLMVHDSQKVEHHLETIETVTRTSAELVRRLASIGSRPSGTVELMDVREFLRDFVPVLTSVFDEEHPVDIEVGEDPLMVICEKAQLESAILNLLVNAREAVEMKSPDQRRITLSAKRVLYDNLCWSSGLRGPFIEIEVADNGSGMPAEIIERATEVEYSSADYSSARTPDSIGLGLPMVFGFARQNGGDTRIESQLGEGTRVQLALPESADHALSASDMSAVQLPMGHNQTILVVDDDPALRATMREMLSALNYEVVCASNGHDALTKIGDNNLIALAIIDIVLPDQFNGVEVARQAVAVQPDLAVIFTSGYSGSVNDSLDALDWPFMQKPLSLPGLANIVAEMIPEFPIEDSSSRSQLRLH